MALITILLLRVIEPIALIFGAYFRRNFMSLVYLLLFVISPFLRLPTDGKTGPTNAFLIVVIVISALMTLGHIIFHVSLIVMSPYGHQLINCGTLETAARHVGFLKLDTVKTITAVRLLAPDLVVLICSVIVYTILQIFSRRGYEMNEEKDMFADYKYYFSFAGKYVSLLLLVCAASIQPSIPGAVYFITFLGAMNWWACNRDLGTAFAYVLKVVMWLMVLHVCGMCVVQWQYVQDVVHDHTNLYFRIFGLTVLATTNCSNPQEDHFIYTDWDYYVSPIVILIAFNVLAITSGLLLETVADVTSQELQIEESSDSIKINMEEGTSTSQTFEMAETLYAESAQQVAAGPVVSKTEFWLAEEELLYLRIYFTDILQALQQLLVENSYVAASFAMMAWSITYHSWVSFVLLVWTCLAWIFPPNQRTNMLRSSPFLVIYAQLLLCAQYIYSMDLAEDELPQYTENFNMVQLGFQKYPRFPVWHMLLKCLYTSTFWIVLQQFWIMREELRMAKRRGTWFESRNPLVKLVAEIVIYGLAKYWIWVAGVLWFAMGFVGVQMTVQRVLYMGLFLLYILNFQITYSFWRRTLYASWLGVALYSLLVLIIIYTFQFDNFPHWWEKYLKLPPHLQRDFGLRRYESAHDLVTHLLPVVLFISAAVVFLHLYHDMFLARTDPERIAELVGNGDESVEVVMDEGIEVEAETEVNPTAEDDADAQEEVDKEIKGSFKEWLLEVWEIFTEFFWRFLYTHLYQIAVFMIGAVCIVDVCPPHFVLLVVVIIALVCHCQFNMLAIHTVALAVSFFVMVRMIYQFDYFDHGAFNVTCLDSDENEYSNENDLYPQAVLNDAAWLGLHKISNKTSLFDLVKGYFGLIFVFTILSCAIYRFRYMLVYNEMLTGEASMNATLMFPGINRRNADDSIINLFKFLTNYGFYKFGVEISFIAMALLIAVRLDLYAILYGVWLCFMVFLSRRVLARVWILFIIFIVITIPLQYVMLVALPDSMCIVYPWNESYVLRNIQQWFYLPDSTRSLPSFVLLCDFVVLMLACHQYYVFLIEAEEYKDPYDGGSNKDIAEELLHPEFRNPIPDFFCTSKSWLDSLKRIGCRAFLWLTLSVVFFAGVNRVNVFSFGYLGVTFFYLWRGEKLYLLPNRQIIWQWNCFLLGYNLAVMMLKMILQLVGCIFVSHLMDTACWAIELLGISCYTEYIFDIRAQTYEKCPLPDNFAGLWWDVACFSALVFMRRFFGSYYFLHLVNETKVMLALRDRGAYLFEKYHEKKTEEMLQTEDENIAKVLRNMKQIIEHQKRIQGSRFKKSPWHYQVIRDGDYYMFEMYDDVESESDEEVGTEEIPSKQTTEDKKKVPTLGDKPKPTSTEYGGVNFWVLTKFVGTMIESAMVSVTVTLYNMSLDYLYVSRMLELAKNSLKANHEFLAGTYDESGLWQPAKPAEEYIIKLSQEEFETVLQQDESQSTMVLLLSSMYYVLVSNSQYLCIFMICLLQIRSASLMSLPMPIMVFLWGVFISPRPSRKFWVILIAYTKLIIIIKCIFQFSFIPLNEQFEGDHPFETARLFGIERSSHYVTYELLLLLTVYFHRLVQKSMGLWEYHGAAARWSDEGQLSILEWLLTPTVRVPTDVYIYMFVCSFVNFFVLLFGFVSFGVEQPNASVLTIFDRNRIPMQLLITLLLQFAVIIIDRGIYLNRAIRTRLALHVLQVLSIHLWLFFILPATSLRPFNHSVYPQIFYMVMSAYLLFSAYQIRCGFPLRVFGNFIFEGYTLYHFLLFKIYMNIPFLFEIRGIMDWMYTTTTMNLTTYLTMESIYSHVFELQCYGTLEVNAGHASGTKFPSRRKWWLGGIYLIVIFAIIWFPLIIFTVGMAVGTPNPPYAMSVSIEVAGHATMYRVTVDDTRIYRLTADMWQDLWRLYQNNRKARSFLRNYEKADVAVIFIQASSSSVWEASPVDKRRMMRKVANTSEEMTFTLRWQVHRVSKDKTHTGLSSDSRVWVLQGNDPSRQVLSNVLNYNSSVPFTIPRMIPKFLEVTNQDTVNPVSYLMPDASKTEDVFRNVEMRLYVDNFTMQDWWEINEENCSMPSPELLGELPHFRPDCAHMYIYTFNEKMMPLTLSMLISGQGISALYITLVYVIGLFIRSKTVTAVTDITFVEVPTVDRVLQLCLNIYLAREYKELALEEYLYSKLLFLFRSPETFIRWSRPSRTRPDAERAEEIPDTERAEERPDTERAEERPDTEHAEERPDTEHAEERPDTEHAEERPDTERAEERPDTEHAEERPDTEHADDRQDTENA